jgi:hypothetical protein
MRLLGVNGLSERGYSDLREIDQRLIAGLSGSELDQELARLQGIEHQVAYGCITKGSTPNSIRAWILVVAKF